MRLLLLFLLFVSVAHGQPLTVVYANAWKPISVGTGEKVEGILPSLVESILHDEMGLQVRHVGVPWKRAQRMIESGTADAFVTAPTAARLQFTESTQQTFYSLEFRAFAKKGSAAFLDLRQDPNISSYRDSLRFCDVLGNGWAKAFYKAREIDYYIASEIAQCAHMIDRERQMS